MTKKSNDKKEKAISPQQKSNDKQEKANGPQQKSNDKQETAVGPQQKSNDKQEIANDLQQKLYDKQETGNGQKLIYLMTNRNRTWPATKDKRQRGDSKWQTGKRKRHLLCCIIH